MSRRTKKSSPDAVLLFPSHRDFLRHHRLPRRPCLDNGASSSSSSFFLSLPLCFAEASASRRIVLRGDLCFAENCAAALLGPPPTTATTACIAVAAFIGGLRPATAVRGNGDIFFLKASLPSTVILFGVDIVYMHGRAQRHLEPRVTRCFTCRLSCRFCEL